MIRTDAFAKLEIMQAQALHDWLGRNYAQSASVWLVTFKAHDHLRYVSRDEVLDALMCFGWIDGIRRVLDADRTMQLISPRNMQVWAATYKDRVARLQNEGRMQPPGLAAIAQSKAAGLWDALDHVDALIVPDDLSSALASMPDAASWFAGSAPSYRRNILRWIAQAKTPSTRAKRISITCAQAACGQKVPQF